MCATRKTQKSRTDTLASSHPEIAAQWHPHKNLLTPHNVTYGSRHKAWWLCARGHDWQRGVQYRTEKKKLRNCPYCANQKVWKGFNDFASQYPALLPYWSDNNELKPDEIFAHSSKKVLWKCSRHHPEYSSRVKDRVTSSGCNQCSLNGVSKRELLLAHLLRERFPSIIITNNQKFAKRQVDIILTHENQSIFVEYDGSFWHRNLEKDQMKDKFLLSQQGAPVKIIRLREKGCPQYSRSENVKIFSLDSRSDENFLTGVESVVVEVEKTFKIAAQDSSLIYNASSFGVLCGLLFESQDKERSLVVQYPEIASLWHKNLNEPIDVRTVDAHTKLTYWWTCEKGHDYETTVKNICRGSQCPYCCGIKLLRGFNDVATTHPHLLEEWDWDNNTLSPYELRHSYENKITWKCKEGHSWSTNLRARTKTLRSTCPTCKTIKRQSIKR